MILVLDIGNTNITAAVFDKEQIIFDFRLATDKNKSADEYYVSVKSILEARKILLTDIKEIVVCSVVPSLDKPIEYCFEKYFLVKPFFIKYSDKLKLKVKIDVDNPTEVGADRITNAEYCAVNFPERNVIVIDFGTATTFDIIFSDARYSGGIIAPGIALSSKALFNTAAKLFPVNYDQPPKNIIGRNTRDAMLSGIVNGYAAMTDGLIDKIIQATQINNWLIIATGGFSAVLQKLSERINIIDDKITLTGAKIIYEQNKLNISF